MRPVTRRRLLSGLAGAATAGTLAGCVQSVAPPTGASAPRHGLVLVGSVKTDFLTGRFAEAGDATYAVDTTDGTARWELDDIILAGAPLAADGLVYLPTEVTTEVGPDNHPPWGRSPGRVLACDPDDGDVVWEHRADRGFRSLHDGESSIVAATNTTTYCLERDGGEERWDRAGTPVAHENGMVVVYDDEEEEDLTAYDAASGDDAWTYTEEHGRIDDGVTWEGTLVLAGHDGRLHGIDLETGEPNWRRSRVSGGSTALYEVTLVQDRIYGYDSDEMVWCYGANDGELIWEEAPITDVLYPFTVGRSLVIAGTGSHDRHRLDGYDARIGSRRWSIENLGEATPLEVNAVGQTILLTTAGPEGHVLEFRDALSGDRIAEFADLGDIGGNTADNLIRSTNLATDAASGTGYVTFNAPTKLVRIAIDDHTVDWTFHDMSYPTVTPPAVV